MLLAPAEAYKDEDADRNSRLERGEYEDGEADRLLTGSEGSHSDYESGSVTPQMQRNYASSYSSSASSDSDSLIQRENVISAPQVLPTPTNGNVAAKGPGNLSTTNGHITSFPELTSSKSATTPDGPKGWSIRFTRALKHGGQAISASIARLLRRIFFSFPQPVQTGLSRVYSFLARFLNGCWEFMNPPLWAMLIAIIIASVPRLQHLFFDPGTFLSNSVTRAVSQSGGVAVPLILVVLGANLARNTLPKEDTPSMEEAKEERNLLIASLISRMLLPTLIMAPILAITAKFVPVSILDDPIFVIVCFLLTGAPSALQLAQICQINNVYMGAMSRLLFQSYVIWILPSTLILVMLALETVEWAQ